MGASGKKKPLPTSLAQATRGAASAPPSSKAEPLPLVPDTQVVLFYLVGCVALFPVFESL